jgi:predicted transposase YdaD
MKTDIPLHEIFTEHPNWIADAMNEPFPVPSTFTSPVLKSMERRLDGLLTPHDKHKPLRVIEFQFFQDEDIYYRAVEERIGVHRLNPGRAVEAIIFFGHRALDARPEPWTMLVKARYLDEEMVVLAQRNPQHPLPKLLGPIFEKDKSKLEKAAPRVYAFLGTAKGHTRAERQFLQSIYTSLLLSRFKDKTIQEITKMITTLDITKTRAGKELIAMGKLAGKAEGKMEGKLEGMAEGKAEGKAQTLIKLLTKRFGALPKSLVSKIENLNYLQLEKLDDQVLDAPDLAHLTAWVTKPK